MNDQIRIALIPAYKPNEQLIQLLSDTVRSGLRVLVIDDGSGDDYTDIFTQAADYAVVLNHKLNQGKGRAIKTGLKYIQDSFVGCYTVVTMDADGQHKVEDAIKLCNASELQPKALILGSRQLRDNVPLRSRLGNTITRFVYSFSTKTHIHDTQTGLRAFSNELLPLLIDIAGERYEYEMNVLLELSRSDIPITEIEIPTIYLDNNSASHFDTIKDSYRIYKEILKFSLSSFVSFLLDYILFMLLSFITKGLSSALSLSISNIIARVISASVNYSINRKVVFKSKENVKSSVFRYMILAAGILLGNTVVLSLLVQYFNINQFVAKLMTEIIFFLLSWLVQRFFIFNKKQDKREK